MCLKLRILIAPSEILLTLCNDVCFYEIESLYTMYLLEIDAIFYLLRNNV